MPQRDVWSLSVGSWRGVRVRIHLFFLLFAIFTCYLAWQYQQVAGDGGTSQGWLATVCLLLLLTSVAIHELGHCCMAWRLGGHVDAVVLGPLGGLRPIRIPKDPQSELLTSLAGPFTSLAVCMVCLIGASLTGDGNALRLLHPLSPLLTSPETVNMPPWHWHTLIRLACWINWLLVLLNLIPAFPFDGGRACLAFVRAVHPDIEPRRATRYVAALAKTFAVGLLVAAWLFRDKQAHSIAPAWLALVLLSVFVFFSARLEEDEAEPEETDADLFGYDFSQGFTSLERSQRELAERPGPISRWWRRVQIRRQMKRRALEAHDEQQLDEVLMRLHERGIEGLSPAERSLLRRVSARYRSRESQ